MQQDVFMEKLVTRKMRGLDYALIVAALGVIVSGAFFGGLLLGQTVFSFFAPLLVLALCFLFYRLYQSFHVEYEYIFTNGELDIDKIVFKKRRKHILTIDVRSFEIFAPMRTACADEFEKRRAQATIADYASSPKAEGRWFAALTRDGVRTLMIFEPGDKMADAIAKFIPHKTRKVDA